MSRVKWSMPLVDSNDVITMFKVIQKEKTNNNVDIEIVKQRFGREWSYNTVSAVLLFFRMLGIIKPNGTVDDSGISVFTDEEISKFIARRAYERIIAFKLLVNILKDFKKLNKEDLRRRLSSLLLEHAQKNNPDEYHKKIKEIKSKYGDISNWKYPAPSFSRLVRIAKKAGIISEAMGQIEFLDFKAIYEVREIGYKEFIQLLYQTYAKLCEASGTRIQSIDKTRNLMREKFGIRDKQFEDFMLDALINNPKIQVFKGQIGDERGLKKIDGQTIYRYIIRSL